MATLPQLLKGTPNGIDFEVAFVAPIANFPKKDGGTYEAQECQLKTRANGEMYSARLFPSFISKFQIKPGSLVHAQIGANGYPQWTPVDTTEAGLSRPQPTNSQQIRDEGNMRAAKQEDDAKWDRISVGKCLFGYAVAGIELGKTPPEAMAMATELLDLQEKAVNEFILFHR